MCVTAVTPSFGTRGGVTTRSLCQSAGTQYNGNVGKWCYYVRTQQSPHVTNSTACCGCNNRPRAPVRQFAGHWMGPDGCTDTMSSEGYPTLSKPCSNYSPDPDTTLHACGEGDFTVPDVCQVASTYCGDHALAASPPRRASTSTHASELNLCLRSVRSLTDTDA